MPRWIAPVLAVAIVVFGASVLALLMLARTASGPNAAATESSVFAPMPGLESLLIPAFELVDQGDTPVTEEIFSDRYTLVSFVFTNCVLVCPDLTGAMFDLYSRLAAEPVGFVSFSVDPERDTSAVLAEYADRYGIDAERWRFLTGDPETVERIATDGLLFDISVDTNPANIISLADGTSMNNINHPSSILLVGPGRKVLGRYRYQFPEELVELEQRIRTILAVERSRQRD